MASMNKGTDIVCSICSENFTTAYQKEQHERCKHACIVHVVPNTKEYIRKFTDISWQKYLSCVHRWKDLNTPGGQAEVAVEGICRFGLELVYTYDVLLAKQPTDDGTVGYHRKCYNKFTNIANLARTEKRTAKECLELGKRVTPTVSENFTETPQQEDQDQSVPSVASSSVDCANTICENLPETTQQQDQDQSVPSVASNSVDCASTAILGLPWQGAYFSRSVKFETQSDENTEESCADFGDETVTQLHQSSASIKEISLSCHLLPNCCLLCRKKVKRKLECHSGKYINERLSQCKTLSAGRLVQAAEKREDEKLLVQIQGKNLPELEVKYHNSCYKNYTRILFTVIKEAAINVYDLGYVHFCKSIIEERIITKQEVMCITELNEIFKKCVLEKTKVDISSYCSSNLKRRLLISYPYLKILKPSKSSMKSEYVFVGDMSTDKVLKKYPIIFKFSCELCSKKFERKMELNKHMFKEHSKPFKCSLCKNSFVNELKLKDHLCLFHGGEKISCELCEYKCISHYRLKLHIANVHTSKDEKQFACAKCDYRTCRKNKLKIHEKIHTKERLFMCEKCGKQFRCITSLNYHFLTHSNEKPFKCTLCDKSYKSKKKLKYHKLVHTTTEKNYCGDCNYASILKSNLREHVKRVHTNDYLHKCLLCGNKYKHKESLIKHQKGARCLVIE